MTKILKFKKQHKVRESDVDEVILHFYPPFTIQNFVKLVQHYGVEHEEIVMPGLEFIEREVQKIEEGNE
jgi:hypothetical protein